MQHYQWRDRQKYLAAPPSLLRQGWQLMTTGLLLPGAIAIASSAGAIVLNLGLPAQPAWSQEDVNSRRHNAVSQEQVMVMIERYNPQLERSTAQEISRWIVHYSRTHRIHAGLIAGLIARESSFNPRATSSSGARGLGQITPILAEDLGIRNSYNIRQNIEGTTRWLRSLYDVWQEDGVNDSQATTWALASYRQGLTRTRQVGIPQSTADYINDIYAIARQVSRQ